MKNTTRALTKSKVQPPTMMRQLASCTDNQAFNHTLVKIEQELNIRQSLERAPLICYQGKKSETVKEIIRIVEFFLTVTGKELEPFQIIVLAGDLYEKFKNDTLEDIVLMFKMARQGDFGGVYKLDTFTIMDWAKTYFERKSEEREKMLKSKKELPKNEEQEAQSEGKYFHELPKDMQDKFNKFKGKAAEIIPKKATEVLDRERLFRSLSEEKKKPIKFKKYI